jgi:glycine betaine/choline ABC-type transport system substrate-binding protein
LDRAAILILIALLAAGCSSRPSIVVGSKNFTESVLLGEIVAAHLERRDTGVAVERKLNLGGTLLAHEAVKRGAIDVYPEYTGTALMAVLSQPAVRDAGTALERVREGYGGWGLEWLDPLGFDNSYAMVVRAETARARGVKTLSDAARSGPWRMGVGYEFTERRDGLRGLVETYGLQVAGGPVAMDLGLLYQALSANRVDMAAASATDGMLARSEFAVLEDDRRYFPPYEGALVVRREVLERHPKVRSVLTELSGRISEAAMRRMNAAVDVERRPAADVAREFVAGWQ